MAGEVFSGGGAALGADSAVFRGFREASVDVLTGRLCGRCRRVRRHGLRLAGRPPVPFGEDYPCLGPGPGYLGSLSGISYPGIGSSWFCLGRIQPSPVGSAHRFHISGQPYSSASRVSPPVQLIGSVQRFSISGQPTGSVYRVDPTRFLSANPTRSSQSGSAQPVQYSGSLSSRPGSGTSRPVQLVPGPVQAIPDRFSSSQVRFRTFLTRFRPLPCRFSVFQAGSVPVQVI